MNRPAPVSRTRSEVDLIVLGYSAPDASEEARRRMTDFSIMLSQLAMIDVSIAALPSYERVAQLIYKGEIDLAWLSPIPYISLARRDAVMPIVSQHRGASGTYHSAILVNAASRTRTLASLKGKRAAWVDRHSASGFVLPRVEFWEAGIDPRKAFSSQRMYGSHEAVVRAVAEGRADFGATFAQVGADGEVTGSWSHTRWADQVRVLTTIGEIPSDVIVARSDFPAKAREIVTKAFLRLAKVTLGMQVIEDVFGVHEFRRPDLASYERLRTAAAGAVEDGLLELDTAGSDEDDIDVEIEDAASSNRTMEIRPRSRADSTSEADVLEVIEADVEAPRLVIPRPGGRVPQPTGSRPARPLPSRPVSKPAPPRPAASAPRPAASAPRPAAKPPTPPRPAAKPPTPPRKP